MSHRDFIAMQAMMKYEPVAHYDSGEDGIFPECRSCRFHRPYAQDRTCVFRTCPYAAANHINTQTHPLDSCVCQSYSIQRR